MQDIESERWLQRFKRVVGYFHTLEKEEFCMFCTEQKQKYGVALQKCVIKLKRMIRQFSKCSHRIFTKDEISELIEKCPLEWALNMLRENYFLTVDSLEDVLNPSPSVSKFEESVGQNQNEFGEQQEESIVIDEKKLFSSAGSLFLPPDQNNSYQSFPGFHRSSESIPDQKKKSSSQQKLPEKQLQPIKFVEGERIPQPGVYVKIKCCPMIQQATLDDDRTCQNPELGEVGFKFSRPSY